MNNSGVFRGKSEDINEESKPLPQGNYKDQTIVINEEPPYLDYENINHHPVSVDYFKLSDKWNDPEGGFGKEISVIEEYFTNKVKNGEIANDTQTIKNEIKKIEKLTNVKDEARLTMKLETISAHIKYLMELENIKFNHKRYAN